MFAALSLAPVSVVGYHGTTEAAANEILSTGTFNLSRKQYDLDSASICWTPLTWMACRKFTKRCAQLTRRRGRDFPEILTEERIF